MDKIKSPSLILLVISMIYCGIVGVNFSNVILMVSLVGLYAIEHLLKGLDAYLEANKKAERPITEIDKLKEDIAKEELVIRLEKLKRRDLKVIGTATYQDNGNLTF